MAQFSVNPQRFDPYKNFKFRVKVGRPLRGRRQQSRRAQTDHGSRESIAKEAILQQPKVAGSHRV
jgi:hypothetical protein